MALNIGDICGCWSVRAGHSDKTALCLVGPGFSVTEIRFGEMDALASRFANVLRETGQEAGSVIAILLPKCVEVFYAFLGALKAGCQILPLSLAFGDLGLTDRLADSATTCILTKRSLLPRIERIRPHLPKLRSVLVADLEEDLPSNTLGLPFRLRSAPDHFESVPVQDSTPSVLHYTSGSTGKPKGVLHQHGTAKHIGRTATEVLQLQPNDRFWCTADQGWVTGTSYGIIAPWLLGVTQVQFCGSFDAAAWARVLQDQRVNVWYTAPTALRMMMAADVDFSSFDLSALRCILSVGEPLNPEVSRWALKTIGREIHDTWFQTETGGIMIANRPGLPVRHGSMGCPVTGVSVQILDNRGRPCARGTLGRLCLKRPWPAMFLAYLNHAETYAAKFPGDFYDSGDLASQDEDGYVWFAARGDDVINTSGHLVSPFEVESALLEMPEVAESGAVGIPDPILFEKVVVFVALAPPVLPSEDLALRIRLHVANRLSSIASPQDVVFVDFLPKNNSGKILRRVLRCRYLGQDPGDLSTMQDSQ